MRSLLPGRSILPTRQPDLQSATWGLSNVHGLFGGVTGEITIDPADLSKSSVKATIDTITVDTGVASRDSDLKSPNFFRRGKVSHHDLRQQECHKSGDGYAVTGDLTMHGVTKQVVLMMDAPSKELNMGKQTRRGFDATTSIHRQDFGLKWGGTLKSGDAMIGDNVKVTLEVKATKE